MPDLAKHLGAMADYNRWANRRLYAAAAALPEDDYRRPAGAYFGSLHGTLNHLLVVDRNWMARFEGTGEAQHKLHAILFERLDELRAALPDSLAQARELIGDRDHMVERARQEAERIVANAHAERGSLISDTEVARRSQNCVFNPSSK